MVSPRPKDHECGSQHCLPHCLIWSDILPHHVFDASLGLPCVNHCFNPDQWFHTGAQAGKGFAIIFFLLATQSHCCCFCINDATISGSSNQRWLSFPRLPECWIAQHCNNCSGINSLTTDSIQDCPAQQPNVVESHFATVLVCHFVCISCCSLETHRAV